MRILALAAALALAATAAQAETYTTIPMGDGFSVTTGPDGYSATTVPMGDGFEHHHRQPRPDLHHGADGRRILPRR